MRDEMRGEEKEEEFWRVFILPGTSSTVLLKFQKSGRWSVVKCKMVQNSQKNKMDF
jgi:hypothetical protein